MKPESGRYTHHFITGCPSTPSVRSISTYPSSGTASRNRARSRRGGPEEGRLSADLRRRLRFLVQEGGRHVASAVGSTLVARGGLLLGVRARRAVRVGDPSSGRCRGCQARAESLRRARGRLQMATGTPDQSLWSPARVKAWRAVVNDPSPAPLGVLRIPKAPPRSPAARGQRRRDAGSRAGPHRRDRAAGHAWQRRYCRPSGRVLPRPEGHCGR